MEEKDPKTTPEEGKEPEKTVAQLEEEIKALTAELNKSKGATSRANSEAAEWKRRFNENVDKEKQDAAAREEQEKRNREELEELRRDKRINTYKAKLLEAGIDATTAATMASALPDGVSDEFFTAHSAFMAEQKRTLESAKLGSQAGLSVGLPPKSASKDEEEMNQMRKWFKM